MALRATRLLVSGCRRAGEVVREPGWRIETVTEDATKCRDVASKIRDWFNQESVMVQVEPLEQVEFV